MPSDEYLDKLYETQKGDGRIGGEGYIIEIDETKIGKRKYNIGRRVEDQRVLGMVDCETNHFRLEICPHNKKDADTPIPLIRKHVKPGSLIMTHNRRLKRLLSSDF